MIVAVAPNGARKERRDHPRLPILPDELAAVRRGLPRGGRGHAASARARPRWPAQPRCRRLPRGDRRDPRPRRRCAHAAGHHRGRPAATRRPSRWRCIARSRRRRCRSRCASCCATRCRPPRGRGVPAPSWRTRDAMVQYIVYDADDLRALPAPCSARGGFRSATRTCCSSSAAYAESRAGRPAEIAAAGSRRCRPAGRWSVCAFGAARAPLRRRRRAARRPSARRIREQLSCPRARRRPTMPRWCAAAAEALDAPAAAAGDARRSAPPVSRCRASDGDHQPLGGKR